MKIAVIGTGYVGLVTGVCLASINHLVTCIDIDEQKIEKMRKGISPIFEPGLEELMSENICQKRLSFTSNHREAFKEVQVIFIAVGTPSNQDGKANLKYIETAARDIAENIENDVVVVIKSTVPVGTNDRIKKYFRKKVDKYSIDVVSNPEFLREGSAVQDTFNGDRIVIGSNNEQSYQIVENIFKPLNIPIYKTSTKSAEMIKYASNAFLATKISFINEIANLCEKIGANIEEVSKGMGYDNRIGNQFLNAGIGYGGSCFPKDTKALVQIAGTVEHNFKLLKSVIEVNNNQQILLVNKAREWYGNLKGKTIALLGLSFKPNTDDIREAPSIIISDLLINEGANVIAYDPVSIENAKRLINQKVNYTNSIEEALANADCAFILTEWNEIKNFDLKLFEKLLKDKLIFDGRNCYKLEEINKYDLEYHSIGRPPLKRKVPAQEDFVIILNQEPS